MEFLAHVPKYLISSALVASLIFTSCTEKKIEVVWDQSFPRIGSQSSPRACDLNGDDVLDVVIGAGKNEYQPSDQGILALDGKTGNIIWQSKAMDQVYGSATFLDVNTDGTKDVFIGGRSPFFVALDGKTGELLWKFNIEEHMNDPILRHAKYNFNNSVIAEDLDGDNLPDLLTTNGGNSRAVPGSEIDREPGVLILFSSKTGKIIAADTMPDGKETYMSPIVLPGKKNEEPSIIFGTGGETLSGSLYIASMKDFIEKRLSRAVIIAEEDKHGFIAPPVAVDLNEDAHMDVVAISHGSSIFAIDVVHNTTLWKQKIQQTESSNSFAVGYFNEDNTPDLFTFVSKGEWPNNTGTLQIMLDGKTGKLAYIDSLGCTGFSSPVIYDLNDDGVDEAILSINEFDCARGFTAEVIPKIQNKLIAIDFTDKRKTLLDETTSFKNIFSTPLLGDLDGDKRLDVIHCQYYSYGGLLTFLGMRVKRISLPTRVEHDVSWGAYMGSGGDGIFINQEDR